MTTNPKRLAALARLRQELARAGITDMAAANR